MSWHPFQHLSVHHVTLDEVEETARREQALRWAQEAEALAERLMRVTKATREELERGGH